MVPFFVPTVQEALSLILIYRAEEFRKLGITIDFHIIVSYGVNIATIADNIISNVKYKVEEFTGMSVKKVNVYVEGVRNID